MTLKWTSIGVIAVVAGLMSGCGSTQDPLLGENYGNLLATPGGLTLDATKHDIGWGKSQCNTCHNFNNIHLTDHTGTGIDMKAIQTIVFTDGLSSCATCHGTNGVP